MGSQSGRGRFCVRVLDHPTGTSVTVGGAVDCAAAPLLRAVLSALPDDGRPVLLDLADVTLIDAHSVGMLVGTARRRTEQAIQPSLTLSRAGGAALRALEILGADKLIAPDPPRLGGPSSDNTLDTLLRARIRHADPAVRGGLRELAFHHAYPLAAGLARRYRRRGEPDEDLTQVAALGLLKVIDRYEPDRTTSFPAYAVPTILGELRRHFRDKGWQIRVPRHLQEIRMNLAGAAEVLTQELGRAPTITELAERLAVTDEDVLAALGAALAYRADSLSAPTGPDGNGKATLAEQIGATDPGFDTIDNHESLVPLLAALPARQRRILTMRFYGNQTQCQIAAAIGISQMHVSRLLTDALTQLRHGLTTG